MGVCIPKDLSKINESNYGPIETIKMNLLPQLSYLFQSLPVMVTPVQFNKWDKWISRFIWVGIRPRIQFKTLQLFKEKGGRSLSYLADNYKAAQLRPLACC